MDVSLREVTAETVRTICELRPRPPGDKYVAPNAVSIAEACFDPTAWYRAVYANDEPVGFVMLEDDIANREYFLWRLMIAEGHERKGYGRRVVDLLCDYVRTRPGATELLTSWGPGDDGPERFYRRIGFEPTGEVDDGEIVARRPL